MLWQSNGLEAQKGIIKGFLFQCGISCFVYGFMFEQCKVKGFLAVVVAVMIVVMGGTSAFILSELINIHITFMT